MKLTKFEIYSYELPTIFGSKKGLLVRLTNDLGKEGVGEIAPLENRSAESLQEALAFTKNLRLRFLKGDFTKVLFPPSVMFGMEMALSSLLFPLTEDLTFKIYSNKLKLKDLSVEEAVSLCKKESGPLRVDLNRSWDLEKTIAFCNHFQKEDFHYIEEPVSRFRDIEIFQNETGFPYAIDEHLSHHPLERIVCLKGLTHLVVKPTLHGGFTQCEKIIKSSSFIKVVFSSSYETPVGLMGIAKIASFLTPNERIGIDTASIYKEPLFHFDPKVELIRKELYQSPPIPWEKLEKIV
jgi:O-succinylbenzoate synthase